MTEKLLPCPYCGTVGEHRCTGFMLDIAERNCTDHHICTCQKIRLDKAEWGGKMTYQAWLEKRDEVIKLKTELDATTLNARAMIKSLEDRIAGLEATVKATVADMEAAKADAARYWRIMERRENQLARAESDRDTAMAALGALLKGPERKTDE